MASSTGYSSILRRTMKRKKMKPIPPEVKERWERTQRVLAERIAYYERKLGDKGEAAPPQT
jgi:hypothetical protein